MHVYANTRPLALVALLVALLVAGPSAQAPSKVTTPEQFFGHQIGADYVLPNYTKFS